MSSKSIQQPAHEVILRKLGERVAELHGCFNEDTIFSGGTIRRNEVLGKIGELCDVLREMTIPKRARENVLARLHLLADMWNKRAETNLIDAVRRDILSRE
ncbi:MAG: hypothetical protein ABII19_01640 [Patescibacteria group bacterium]